MIAILLVTMDGRAQTRSPAVLANAQVGRGDSVGVNFDEGPAKESPVRMTLQREGQIWDAENPDYNLVAAGARMAGAATATIPASIPLGDYVVTLQIGARQFVAGQRLSIRPGGGAPPTLAEFSPAGTYDSVNAYVPTQWEGVRVAVATMALATPVPRNERQLLAVLRDGRSLEIVWNGCVDLPGAAPRDRPESLARVFARADAKDQVTLCRVPSDATIRRSGIDETPQSIVPAGETWVRGTPKAPGVARRVLPLLVLRGGGFQYDQPRDNVIRVNDERRTVEWSGCGGPDDLGTESAPRDLSLRGQAVSSNEIRLCGLEVPASGELRVSAGYGDTQSAERSYRVFAMRGRTVATYAGLIALVLALLPLGLLAFVRRSYPIKDQTYKLRMLFLDPETDTYSLSKLQFYLWTVASIFSYSYFFISRVAVQNLTWPDIPGTLPGIIAVSGGTAVGAQAVTAMKGSKGGGEQEPSFADFITTGGVVAPDRLQMFTWTLFGVGAFIYAVLQQGPGTIAELPALPERLVYLMGLSSAGYLAGKIARKAGPVINEISVTPAESDAKISKSSAAASGGLPNLVAPIADAQARLAAIRTVTTTNAKAAVDAVSRAIKAAGAAHTTSEMDALITELGRLRTAAESSAAKASDEFTQQKASADEAQAAQQAAAAMQDFVSDVLQAISHAAVAPMLSATEPPLVARTIELRGTNLSPDALLEIEHVDLPFKMLLNPTGQNAPEVVLRDETTPTLAKVLRLQIDPARLATVELERFRKWFGEGGRRSFSITNPDGQKAELPFELQ